MTHTVKFTLEDIQKTGRQNDMMIGALVYRPLSYYLAFLIANYTAWLPNQISLLTVGLVVICAALLAFGSAATLAAGGIILFLAHLLDYVDGDVARLKHACSKSGAWLEAVKDGLEEFLVIVGLLVGSYRLTHEMLYVWMGLGALFAVFMDRTIYPNTLLVTGGKSVKQSMGKFVQQLSHLLHIRPEWIGFTADYRGAVIIVASLLAIPHVGLVVLAIVDGLQYVVVLIVTWVNIERMYPVDRDR